jgi:hypothetical protein
MRHPGTVMLVFLAACDGPGTPVELDAAVPPPPDAAPDASRATRIEVTIEYGGAVEGTLLAAAFRDFPPQGPPVAVIQQAAPTFPAALVLDDLEPATVHVLGLLDAEPASPTQPGPEDLTAWSEALALAEGETATVTLTLEDPE